KACVLPENPASYRVVRTKSYLFNKACLLQKRISLKPVGLKMVFFCPEMTSCEQKKNLKEWLSHSEIALAGRKDSDFEF
ncbi:hypothetical protein, partial [Klebsiella pneumoniae]|uniref:hypothetical protein n=1 Tax=Klebsiella pneumoniae TaxID=573 RepID=UPI003D02AFE8